MVRSDSHRYSYWTLFTLRTLTATPREERSISPAGIAARPEASTPGPTTSTSSPSRITGSASITPGARISPWGMKSSMVTRYPLGMSSHPFRVGRSSPVPASRENMGSFPRYAMTCGYRPFRKSPFVAMTVSNCHDPVPCTRSCRTRLSPSSAASSAARDCPETGCPRQVHSSVIPSASAAISATARAPPSRCAITLR